MNSSVSLNADTIARNVCSLPVWFGSVDESHVPTSAHACVIERHCPRLKVVVGDSRTLDHVGWFGLVCNFSNIHFSFNRSAYTECGIRNSETVTNVEALLRRSSPAQGDSNAIKLVSFTLSSIHLRDHCWRQVKWQVYDCHILGSLEIGVGLRYEWLLVLQQPVMTMCHLSQENSLI